MKIRSPSHPPSTTTPPNHTRSPPQITSEHPQIYPSKANRILSKYDRRVDRTSPATPMVNTRRTSGKPPVISIVARQWLERLEAESKQNSNPYDVPEDFREFAKLCKVRSGVDFVPFHLYDYQEELGRLIDLHPIVAVLKTRQVGWSETVSCKMLHRSLLNPAYLGVAFSLGQTESSKLSDRVGLMPSQIKGFQWSIDSKTARKSEKGGELLFRPSTPNAARSLASLTDLFADECSFPADIEEMYGNATPAQSMVGEKARRILGSTIAPNGLECWFGQTFWTDLNFDLEEEIGRVQEGRGRMDRGFSYWIDGTICRVLLHWQSHPIYSSIPDYLNVIRQREQITEDQLQREHNMGIPKSGGSLFSLQSIESSSIGQWESPVDGAKYLLGVDANMGGEDNWVTQVWRIDIHPFRLVAEYAENNMLPSYCTAKTLELIDAYRPTICVIEKNNGGLTISENIIKARSWLQVELVNTTSTSKTMNTDRIAIALTSGDVVFPSDWEGIGEMKRFSREDRKAMGNAKDDRVMAWSVTFALLDEALKTYDTSWYA